ncbi:hypothetical protein [Sediminibacillus massiliensis]|uniref:hypothetical protein n=1 Tax=Sediminibacillus massiliensis TaxID=1926277 RepID=UPI00098846C1|nr:hypothetical protein [Sediminibacillus massiliensis]
MLKVDFDEETAQLVADKIANMAFEKIKTKLDQYSKWPPILTKKDLMEFLQIKDNKASELLNRDDFPVIREFGHPRVSLQQLMYWIDQHTDWVKDNAPKAKYPYRVI